VNAKLAEIARREASYEATCMSCRTSMDRHFDDLYKTLHKEVATLNAKVNKIEIRIAWIAGVSALFGSGLQGALSWVLKLGGG